MKEQHTHDTHTAHLFHIYIYMMFPIPVRADIMIIGGEKLSLGGVRTSRPLSRERGNFAKSLLTVCKEWMMPCMAANSNYYMMSLSFHADWKETPEYKCCQYKSVSRWPRRLHCERRGFSLLRVWATESNVRLVGEANKGRSLSGQQGRQCC